MDSDVIVIGSGMAGAWTAYQLNQAGYRVIVLDKARGSGGRLSSKRLTLQDDHDLTVDLGCPHLTASSADFGDVLNKLEQDGVLLRDPVKKRCFVPKGRNSAFTRHLIKGCEARFSARATGICRVHDAAGEKSWQVKYDHEGEEKSVSAAGIVISAPPEQALALLPGQHRFRNALKGVHLIPQWVSNLVLSFTDISQARSSLLARLRSRKCFEKVIVENDKPGRDYPDNTLVLTLHFAPGWTQVHLDEAKDNIAGFVGDVLQDAIQEDPALPPITVLQTHVHRWLYSQPGRLTLAEQPYLADEEGIFLTGDYFGASEFSGLERAFLSADSLSRSILTAGLVRRANHA